MRETHEVRHGRCRNDDTFRDFNFANQQLIYCEYRPLRKPAKDVVSPPTHFLPYENHPNMRTYAVPTQLTPRLDETHRHICTLAVATSEPSKPRDAALTLRKTRNSAARAFEFVRRGVLYLARIRRDQYQQLRLWWLDGQ
jgi:hypothetical protein